MKRWMLPLVVGLSALAADPAGAADKPLDQSTIISVRPAVPDGAKQFVNQQSQPPKKPLFGGWFQKKQPPQPGYGYVAPPPPAKPSPGKSFWDIFNPKKWGKAKSPAPDANQQQLQTLWNLTNPAPEQGQLAGSPAFGQMPEKNLEGPASQPGGGQ